MERTCKNCNFCNALYYGYCFMFFKSDMCFCDKKEEITPQDGCCDRWQKKAKEIPLNLERLKEAEEDIIKIKQYLNL